MTGKLFTHSFFSNTQPEVCAPDQAIEAVTVCRNYIAHQSAHRGQVYSAEYHDLCRQGYAFCSLLWLPGKQPKDMIMIKVSEEVREHGAVTGRGDKINSVRLNGSRALSDNVRVVVGFEWDNFTTEVIPCDINRDELRAHLVALTADADEDVKAWAASW